MCLIVYTTTIPWRLLNYTAAAYTRQIYIYKNGVYDVQSDMLTINIV